MPHFPAPSQTPKRLAAPLMSALALACLTPATAWSSLMVTVGTQFTGSTFGTETSFFPPDTMGAVGPNHFVELINGRYRVYNKTTGAQLQTSSLDSFWSSAGVTPSNYAFDPRVLYDPASSRWYAVSVDNVRAANSYLVAVSNSSDPTAGWKGFKIDNDADNSHWADFPTLGIDNDAIYVGANMFPNTGFAGVNTGIAVIPKAGLLAATPTVAGATVFQDLNPDTTGYSVQAAVNLDGGGVNSGGQYLLSDYNTPAGVIKVSAITGSAASPVLLTGAGFLPVIAYAGPPTADQPGTAANLNTSDTRFSGNVIIQNGSLWGVQTVNSGGRAALNWYRINLGTGGVESGLINSPVLDYYFPSIAVNESNTIVLGFSGSGASQYASAYALAGQFNGTSTRFDPTGPLLLKAGVATYERVDGGNRNRWGDYSATTIDPTDNNRFWTIQEYASATNVYSTYVTEITVTGSIPEPSSLALFGLGGLALARRRPACAQPGTGYRVRASPRTR